MGITGLLPTLEHTKVPVNLNQLAGKRVAIDGHCWLHNSLTCCAFELEMGIKTEKYISSFRNKLVQLLDCDIIPVVVFDGEGLPLKSDTAEQRKNKRNIAREKGHEFMKKGNAKAAYEEFRRSARITPEMINNVIKMLDGYKVEHIMSPYEADPQLAYLCKSGHVDAVLTMDSDLLVFGCPHVIFQRYNFDKLYYIQYDSLFTKSPSNSSNSLLDLTRCNPTTFRHLCILSGCDYLESLPKMGLKTAYKYMIGGNTVERAVISHIGRGEKKDEYMKRFKVANAGFLHQIVYCPKSKSYKRLTPLSDSDALAISHEELDLLGTIPNMNKSSDDDIVLIVDSKEKESVVVSEEEEEICPSLSTTKEDDEEEEEEEDSLSTPRESKLPLATTTTTTTTVLDLSIVSSPSSLSKQSVTVNNNNKTVAVMNERRHVLYNSTNIKTSTDTKASSTDTKTSSSTNEFKKVTAQELVNSFQKKSTSSLIRQKSVFGSLKRIQSSNKSTSQSRLDHFFSPQQDRKKMKLNNENK